MVPFHSNRFVRCESHNLSKNQGKNIGDRGKTFFYTSYQFDFQGAGIKKKNNFSWYQKKRNGNKGDEMEGGEQIFKFQRGKNTLIKTLAQVSKFLLCIKTAQLPDISKISILTALFYTRYKNCAMGPNI